MTDGLRQRGMPSSLPTHHHYEKRPPSGAPHEKITVWNTQVPRKLRSLARFRSVRPRNSTDSRRTWPAYGVRDHSRQASPLPPRSDIPVAGCALQNIAAAIVSRLSTDGSFVCLFMSRLTKVITAIVCFLRDRLSLFVTLISQHQISALPEKFKVWISVRKRYYKGSVACPREFSREIFEREASKRPP